MMFMISPTGQRMAGFRKKLSPHFYAAFSVARTRLFAPFSQLIKKSDPSEASSKPTRVEFVQKLGFVHVKYVHELAKDPLDSGRPDDERPDQVSMLYDVSELFESCDLNVGARKVMKSDASIKPDHVLLFNSLEIGNGRFGRVLVKHDPDKIFLSFPTWHPLGMSANIPYPSRGHAKSISPEGGGGMVI